MIQSVANHPHLASVALLKENRRTQINTREAANEKMALDGWTVVQAEKVEENIHLLHLSHKDGKEKKAYAAKYELTKDQLVDHGKHYSLKLTWLYAELSPLFGLVKTAVYTDAKAIYFSVPGDPETTEVRADERLVLARVVDPDQLTILRRALALRWALGLPSRAAQLRWRPYPEGSALVSASAYCAPGNPGGAYIAKRLEATLGDKGMFMCEQFGLKSLQAASEWRNKILDEARSIAMRIDPEITFVASNGISALYEAMRGFIGHEYSRRI